MCKRILSANLLALVFVTGALGMREVIAQGKPMALAHEGKAVNGLRLEVAAKFVPEQPNWGSPKLETTFTFHNLTDKDILLDGWTVHFRLVLSRVAPLDAVTVSTAQSDPWCPAAPQARNILRVPARKNLVFRRWHWCDTLDIPRGLSNHGKLLDADTCHRFKLKRPGKLTLVFAYRSNGAYAESRDLHKLLRPMERFWSGRVYSNPVVIDVTKVHKQ